MRRRHLNRGGRLCAWQLNVAYTGPQTCRIEDRITYDPGSKHHRLFTAEVVAMVVGAFVL